jgi:uncharacterized protein YqjF (DUF2071 family)
VKLEPISAAPREPVERPLMRQSWLDLTFLHWRYEPAAVRALVPRELELDLYDGAAWVGLVPFRIAGLTHPRAPEISWLSNFPETNVRTYVFDHSGRRGVWFFSLDAARWPAVLGARSAYALPYYWARMRVECAGESVRYESERLVGPGARSDIEVQIGAPIAEPSDLELFLTARFRLYARRRGSLLRADIELSPWPLQQAHAVRLEQSLVQAAGLPDPVGPPLVHFSRRVDVMVGRGLPLIHERVEIE